MMRGARILGHAVHPMLIVFPLGLLATAVVFDILFLTRHDVGFAIASYWNIGVGLIGGLLAAVFGLWDWLTVPQRTRARRIGAWHGLVNLTVVLMFAGSWVIRRREIDNVPTSGALALSFIAIALALVGGWLGGEMVERHGVGVDQGANVDASSSLSGEPARSTRDRDEVRDREHWQHPTPSPR